MADPLKQRMKQAVLEKKVDVGDKDLSIFYFKLAEPVFSFKPGQYATLGIEKNEKIIARPYSIASSPRETRHLEFYIIRVDNGQFTTPLFQLKEGDALYYMNTPKGKFTLERTLHAHLVMVATGTGLAPFISMMRTVITDKKEGKDVPYYTVTLMHGARLTQDLGYRDELDALEKDKTHLDFMYLPTVSRPQNDPLWKPDLCQGRVNDVLRHIMGEAMNPESRVEPKLSQNRAKEDVAARLPQEKTAFFLCGNPGMNEDIKNFLPSHNHKEIFTEDYW